MKNHFPARKKSLLKSPRAILFSFIAACPILISAGCNSSDRGASARAQKSSVVTDAPWQKFSPAGGNFALLMPGIPTETVSIQETVLGPLEDHSFLLKAVQGKYKAGYLISYVDYPPEKRGVLSDSEVLETTFQAIREDNKDRMIYKKKVKIKNHHGIEYQYSGAIQKGHLVTGRNYLIDNRLLILTAVMSKPQFDRGDATRYLDSLELAR